LIPDQSSRNPAAVKVEFQLDDLKGNQMDAQPKVRLEDEVEDVLAKAMTGLGLSPQLLAERAGLSINRVQAALHGAVEAEALSALADVLGLGAQALLELGDGSPGPDVELPDSLRMLNTPHPVPGYMEMTVNSYLLFSEVEPKAAVAFDAGSDATEHRRLLSAYGQELSHLFLTHTHKDHVAAYTELVQASIAVMTPQREPYRDAKLVRNGQVFDLAGCRVEARETYGHSPGGMTYHIEGVGVPVAIVGDAVFCRSMGKVPKEHYRAAIQMIRAEILALPDETILCPGHGPLTTVGFEKQHNPFFIQRRPRECSPVSPR
jgi:glyoxylase-like metal-dependent hydrolase (beta-lactamase superfamily II)